MGLNVLMAKHRQLRDSFTQGAVALTNGAWLRDYAKLTEHRQTPAYVSPPSESSGAKSLELKHVYVRLCID